MTVAEVIELLQAVTHKDMTVFIDCSHCGKALEFYELHEIVLLNTKSGVRNSKNEIEILTNRVFPNV
jgi:hypothetical protein